jgi:hypothetical protein
VISPWARASRRIAAPNCSSTRIDHLLAGGDGRRLLGGERRGEAEQALLERGAVIEGQDVERPIVSDCHVNFSPA